MKTRRAFGARMQAIVLVAMILSFVLIIQEMNMTLHKVGLLLLIVSALRKWHSATCLRKQLLKRAGKS